MSPASPMLQAAIRTANRLGLTLQEGARVEATGNCLLEAVRGNIEDRDVFTKKIEETVSELRRNAAEEGETVIGASPYRIEDLFLKPSEYHTNPTYIESRSIAIKRDNSSAEGSPELESRKIEIQIVPSEPEIDYWDNDLAHHINSPPHRKEESPESSNTSGVETWSRYHPLQEPSDTINMWTITSTAKNQSRNINKSLNAAFI